MPIGSAAAQLALDAQHFVRVATRADVHRIAQIWQEGMGVAFAEYASELTDASEAEAQLTKLVSQQSADFKFWVCLDDQGVIVGWCTVQPFHTTPLAFVRNSYGFISLYMSNDCRGRGVGGLLISFAIAFCKSSTSIQYVIGIQDRTNLRSVAMCERVGFRDFGQLEPVKRLRPRSIIICTTGELAEHPKEDALP